ncbi:MAG: hypothetical protein EP330_24515 [Deltaproteobacteria bacterium]|nr:MAG: hypothetical protein EP330_24515 [Deltaproteobacteria bacterium]
MQFLRVGTLALLATLAACGGSETPAEKPAEAEEPATPETPALDKSKLEADAAVKETLVPSPLETQKALESSGIETTIGSLVTDKTYNFDTPDKDNVAVRTGVVVADLLLTVGSVDKDKLVQQLGWVREGMGKLEGGSDVDAVVKDIQDRVKDDSVDRDALVLELDELSQAVIPELEFNGQDRIVPLIQAGSWLEGANLLAKACKSADKPSAADGLLKQPPVVDYFLKYVTTEGAEKAPEGVTKKLEEALTELKGLSQKSEPFTSEDIDKVIQITDDVLALL